MSIELQKRDLKITALKEELSRVQELNADFRVEITVLNARIEELDAKVQEYEQEKGYEELAQEEDESTDR